MSNFTKKLAKIRATRLNKKAEGEDQASAYIAKMAEWGVTIDPENPKAITKEDSWTSIILLAKSENGKEWLEGTLMAETDKSAAIALLLEKIREINNEFSEFGGFFSQVSETKLREYEMIILPKVSYKGMTGGQAIATWLYGAMNTFYGDGVIYTAELEDEELEKMAKKLTAEFGEKVRSMLASLKK